MVILKGLNMTVKPTLSSLYFSPKLCNYSLSEKTPAVGQFVMTAV